MKTTLLTVAVAAVVAGYTASSSPALPQASTALRNCPAHAPKFASGNTATKHFVRRGAQLVQLCRYSNVNWGDSQGLLHHRLVHRAATISRLTRDFNALQEPPRGIFCMRDDGSEVLVVFGYASGHPERVIMKLTGCRFASNGRATRSTTAGLYHRLVALTDG